MSFSLIKSSRLNILILYVGLIMIRVPEIIWPGRFWAEEGFVYFREAYMSQPWNVLINSHQGYYSLFNKIASITAVYAVPLEFSPIITMSFALIAQVLPVWLLLYSRIHSLTSRFSQLCAVAIVLFIQPNQEIWLNTINSQFFLFVSVAIIFISEPTKKIMHIIRLGILVIAGLTGVVSCLLLPLFVIEYIWTRKRYKLDETIVLAAVTAIQGVIVMSGSGRDIHFDFNLLAFVLFVKQWILPILGSNATDLFSNYIKQHHLYYNFFYALVALLPYTLFGIGLIIWGKRHSWLLFATSISIASISFLTSVEAQSADTILGHLSAVIGGRYYYGPNVLMGLALIIFLSENKLRSVPYSHYFRKGCIVIVGLMITVGAYDFMRSNDRQVLFFTGPSWQVEVKNWRENRKDVLSIWPRPWSIALDKSKKVVEP